MPFRAEPLGVSEDERQELQRMSLSRLLPAGDVFRARLILMLAEGRSYTEVQKRLKTTAPTISKWRKRFVEQRIDGLMQERHPGQKPSVITPQLQAKVLAATRRKPSDGSTHWSCRKLAKELGISKDVVHRIWRTAGLRPHRLERYIASNDPDFERKAADIIGLYLNPPQHRLYSVWTRNQPSRLWTVSIRSCRCLRAVPNAMVLSITGTELCPCMRPWM
jgi:transposase